MAESAPVSLPIPAPAKPVQPNQRQQSRRLPLFNGLAAASAAAGQVGTGRSVPIETSAKPFRRPHRVPYAIVAML